MLAVSAPAGAMTCRDLDEGRPCIDLAAIIEPVVATMEVSCTP